MNVGLCLICLTIIGIHFLFLLLISISFISGSMSISDNFWLIYLSYKKVNFQSKYTILFGLFLTLFTFVNFGYADLTFSDRVLKISLVFFYSFLFVVVYNNYDLLDRYRLVLMVLILIPLLYSVVSQLVEQREYLFNINLFLGNFFSDWHGGLTDLSGRSYHKYMD